jgi:hypothetical protein
MDDRDLVDRLRVALVNSQMDLAKWNSYYEGTQSLSYMAPELQRELDGRVRQVVVNWPRLVVDSLEERLDVEGFRLSGQSRTDDRLWGWWQANGLDEASQQAHIEALASRRAYVIVGSPDSPGDAPVITVESATQVFAWHDPRTRKVTAAVKCWRDDSEAWQATLYLPDRTVWFTGVDRGGEWYSTMPGAGLRPTPAGIQPAGVTWQEVGVDYHNLGVVPVVPIVNRGRILDQTGVSELADIVPLSDAASKIATDMMVSAEFHAIPRRWIVGMTEADMVDSEGRELSQWSRLAGRIWASGGLPSEVAMGQFPEADLRNFHETLNSLAKMVAAMSGLPPHFFGYSDANPASADAIRSAETRLVKRAERRQRAFGGAWEQVMRLALLIADGSLPEGATSLETVWRDASTPTIAQKADAVAKLRAENLISLRQAREDLGYTAEQIALMEADDTRAVDRVLMGDFTSLLGPKPVAAQTTPPAITDGA